MQPVGKQIPASKWNPGVTSLKSLEYYWAAPATQGMRFPIAFTENQSWIWLSLWFFQLMGTESNDSLKKKKELQRASFVQTYANCRNGIERIGKKISSSLQALWDREEKNSLKEYSSSSHCKQPEGSIATTQSIITHCTSLLYHLH